MSALWTEAALRDATGGVLRVPFSAAGVSIDTRTLRPGDLFVALVGENGDGHAHVAAALAGGAAGAMVHALPADVGDDAKLLQVADTLEGLRGLAKFARRRFGGRLVAVTGSVGKTTTKEMLRTILSAHGKTWAAAASHNNHWGVPLTLARLPADAQYCVVEIGMNHAGEIAPLARLARPDVAVITNVERAHVGHLGSLEAIADEKASICAGLESDGIAILPADSAMFSRLVAQAPQMLTFGSRPGVAGRLLSAHVDADGTDVAALIEEQAVQFRLGAPGRHMAMNAVAALLATLALGGSIARGAAALAGFTPVAGRGARRRIAVGDGEAILLDESYNASGVAVRAALEVLAAQTARRRIVVLGDMLELGEDGPAEHLALVPAIAACADLMFACGNLMRLAFDAMPAERRGAHAGNSAELAPLVRAALRPGDAVLVKGSLGSKMKRVIEALESVGVAG